MSSDTRVLRASSLTKSYGRRVVVREVALEIRQGEVVGLLGPNGAGKTTTFYMVVGLARPDSGQVFLGDEDITALPMYQRARAGIGYLPQEASIFRKLTAEENVLAILETRGLPGGRAARARPPAARGAGHPGDGPPARLHALRRRAAAARDLPGARGLAVVHPARRAVRGHRPARRARHPEDHRPPARPRDRHPDHRPQRARDLENHGSGLYSAGTAMSSARELRWSSPRTPRCAASTSARASASTAARPEAPARRRSLDRLGSPPEARPLGAAVAAAHPHARRSSRRSSSCRSPPSSSPRCSSRR